MPRTPAMHPIWIPLLPELGRFAPSRRAAMLARARQAALSPLELLATACAVIAVVLATRWLLPGPAAGGGGMRLALQLGVAAPLLALVLLPLHLRRIRRALRELGAPPASPPCRPSEDPNVP